MTVIGVTGTIGSGKTTVCKIFELLGTRVYYADPEAKKFFLYPDVKDALLSLFGEKILRPDNQIDNKIIAGIAFNDPSKLKKLNDIIHPLVKKDLSEWISANKHEKYVLFESAILFESGFDKECDKVLVVSSPASMCIDRIIANNKANRKEVVARMQNQWSNEEKVELADYVIYNDGKNLLIRQVLEMQGLFDLRFTINDV